MESVEALTSGAEQTELLDQVETTDTTVDDVDTSTDVETTTSTTTETTETSTDVDPEEAERIAWQKEFESAPPRVQQALIREAERRQALEEQIERQQQTSRQPQARPDNQSQDAELRKFLVDNKRISFEAQMRAINAQAAGNEAEYEKQLEIMAQADLNIGRINEQRARQATAADFSAKARPFELATEIKSIKHFEPFHDAAPEIADVHAVLEHFVGSEKAYALMDRALRKVALSAGSRTAKQKPTLVPPAEKARVQNRSRSEAPDGGVSSGGGGTISEKEMDAWVDRVLNLKKQRH